MVKRKDDSVIQEESLAGQIPEFTEPVKTEEVPLVNNNSMIGKKLSMYQDTGKEEQGTSYLGKNIHELAEIREGWMPVDNALLKERGMYYPDDWVFYIRPATVEVIRNWSMIDENNGNSIDDVFNEIIKYCLSIKTATGTKPWHEINHWDRFFFVLLIREYTFVQGESKVEYYEDCPNCDNPVKFTLTTNSLMYDLPSEDVMEYFDRATRTWIIDPNDFDIPAERPITLFIPTIEREANIKAWMIKEYQENENKKFDPVFIKFLPWLCPKISKDINIAKTQIRKVEMVFKSWDSEMFSFMDDVLKNISVTPSTNILSVCQTCGEEVTARLRFPDGVGALFNVVNRRKKFGTK